ncbi:probable E3 ubiquitin-protein ligase TRIML2 [Artibeus jamaicensis]|uniref:probable E3 ubiquitin-protein ligase TRIML2 n=1 Tax=Artibeus jamaicensis TaxID=9417 RepID=UPI00235AAD37|nr:probable E3 ubiquitin-protein ligase TRIML2 [Artibeus jamaicensis]
MADDCFRKPGVRNRKCLSAGAQVVSCPGQGGIPHPNQNRASLHLGIHARMFRSIISEEEYCQKHLELRLLFCEEDQAILCGKCLLCEDHETHMVCGIQEAAENYRKLFWELSSTLEAKLGVTRTLLAEEQEKMVIIQEEEQDFREMIESEYKMIFRLMTEESDENLEGPTFNLNLRKATSTQRAAFVAELEDKFQEAIQKLRELRMENMSKLQESELRLYEQIYVLQVTIQELESKCEEMPLVLLKDARDYFERGPGTCHRPHAALLYRGSSLVLLQSLEPAQIMDPRLCQIPGIRKILGGLQRPVTLDPTTAHPFLLLCEHLRTVRFRTIQQNELGHPERFDYSASVLGVESFTSGRHYWEVDVGQATKWQLGVYEDTASGPDIMLKASGDKCLLMASMMGADCTFWAFPPLKRVFSGERIHRVGVFLDYKYGQVAFYDVTKGLLIYSFSHLVFDGVVKPLFSLCFPRRVTDTESLTICLPEADSYDGAVDPQPSHL